LERAQERNVQSAKMVAVDKLANGVAHEINNPPAAILGFAQLGKQKLAKVDGETVDAEEISYLDRYLGFVETEAKRCGQIISRVLSFTLSPEPHMVPTDVNMLVEQVIKMNINQLGQSGVTPVLALAQDLSKVNGELTRSNSCLRPCASECRQGYADRRDPQGFYLLQVWSAQCRAK